MVDIFFPLKSIKVHEDDKPYINGRIKHLIRKRDKAYQSGRVEHYKTLRNSTLFYIDVNKAPGPFDPNLKLLKMFPEYFAIPLTDIYNQSFNHKIFPEVWKISNIACVPKLQPCSTVEDLRPIALTSVLSKIQESYVMDWVLEDTRDRISDSQFGGLAGMSAVTALLFMLHKWYQAMETSKRIIRVTFLDFRKAFDLIDHNQLLKNFDDIGVRPGVISWYASYLNKRSQI